MKKEHPQSWLWPIIEDDVDEDRLWLRWLVRLRWVAIAAQFITVTASFSLLASPWLVAPMYALIAMLAAGNLQALRTMAENQPVTPPLLLGQLTLDVVALTMFFLLAGGPDNPFTLLYLIHVAMAAVMLEPRRALSLTGVVLACYAFLHAWHLPLHLSNAPLAERTLQVASQLGAMGIAAVSLVAFVVGLATTLRRRTRQLLEARDRTARTDRLRSVGTLAAGAAHELNTPLSTIGLRLRRVGRRHEDAETQRDIEVMNTQLERCSRVVEQLLVGAGDPSASGLEKHDIAELVREGSTLWRKGSGVAVDLSGTEGLIAEVPRIAFVQALINLLENAREAQEEIAVTEPIQVRILREDAFVVVEIRDHGVGMPDGSDRVGEPFYTTKVTGTGLGVFVARAVADGSGGGLSYHPAEGRGTVARWWFTEVYSPAAPSQEPT